MYSYLTGRLQLSVTLSHVQEAMRVINTYLGIKRRLGFRPTRRHEAIYHGNNWCWSINGHNKLKPYGFEIYGAIDAHSRRILWFYVGITNST